MGVLTFTLPLSNTLCIVNIPYFVGWFVLLKTKNNLFRTYHSISFIWLIFTRTVTPLEISRWFPQIVFTLGTCVRPINVGFLNRFFCLSDKRCLILIIKKILRKINVRVRFLALKIAFWGGFENDNILSSKSYTVTKSRISP